MPPTIPGRGDRAVVVVSRFNEGVTRRLLDGAVAELTNGPFADDAVDVVWVPGAFEIPGVMAAALGTGEYRLGVAEDQPVEQLRGGSTPRSSAN